MDTIYYAFFFVINISALNNNNLATKKIIAGWESVKYDVLSKLFKVLKSVNKKCL